MLDHVGYMTTPIKGSCAPFMQIFKPAIHTHVLSLDIKKYVAINISNVPNAANIPMQVGEVWVSYFCAAAAAIDNDGVQFSSPCAIPVIKFFWVHCNTDNKIYYTIKGTFEV